MSGRLLSAPGIRTLTLTVMSFGLANTPAKLVTHSDNCTMGFLASRLGSRNMYNMPSISATISVPVMVELNF